MLSKSGPKDCYRAIFKIAQTMASDDTSFYNSGPLPNTYFGTLAFHVGIRCHTYFFIFPNRTFFVTRMLNSWFRLVGTSVTRLSIFYYLGDFLSSFSDIFVEEIAKNWRKFWWIFKWTTFCLFGFNDLNMVYFLPKPSGHTGRYALLRI